jgi:hypothetical protein
MPWVWAVLQGKKIIYENSLSRNSGSVVDIVTMIRVGRSGVWIPAGARHFSRPLNVQFSFGEPRKLLFIGYRDSFARVRRTGRELGYLPSSGAEVSGTILIMLLYKLMAWTQTIHHFKNDEFLMNTVNTVMIFARECHVMITTEPDSLQKLLNERSAMLLLAFSVSFSFQPSLTRDSVWRGK